jgi:response regulator RpfG family c-di-GMP phosphodiesterase
VVSANDDLVDRLAVKRNAFFVNGLGADQRFAEMLFRQGNDRLLATPLFSRGRLVGFIDMRDKAGKKPFETPDIDAAKRIAEEVLSLLSKQSLFGVAALALVPEPPQRIEHAPGINAPVHHAPPPPAMTMLHARNGAAVSDQALRTIESARDVVAKRNATQYSGKRVLTEADIEVIRLLLPAAIAIPGAVLASFSAMGHVNNPQTIVAIATVTDDALEMLQKHLQAWLQRTNQPVVPMRHQLIYPFGQQVVPITAAGISTILSAPVNPQSVEGLVLTVAFERTPEAQAQRALTIFLRQIEQSVESAMAATSGRNDRQAIAERLLEPDFQKFPELAEHCRHVAHVANKFARSLDLPPLQVENIRLAALVHDVGMRLLDYDRIYKKASLAPDELRALFEHPTIGAAIVEPFLGSDVAQTVLRHHERVDGRGYPSRLSGNQIPLAARIVQIADAWVAMTSRHSYQIAVPPQQAMAKLREGAGTQFDGALVERFLRIEL